MKELTQNLIVELFNYHDGNLYRKMPVNYTKISDKVGCLNKNLGLNKIGVIF